MVAITFVVGACSSGGGVGSGGSGPSSTPSGETSAATPTGGSTSTTQIPACPETTPSATSAEGTDFVTADDAAALVAAVSAASFDCAADVVVVSDADIDRVALAARFASGLGGPILVHSPLSSSVVDSELERLSPQRVVVIGSDVAVTLPPGSRQIGFNGDLGALALRLDEMIGSRRSLTLPNPPGAATVAALVQSIEDEVRLQPPATTTTAPPPTDPQTTATGPSETTSVPSTGEADEGAEPEAPPPVVVGGPGRSGEVWLVDADSPLPAMAAAVAVGVTGGLMGLVNGTDLRRIPEVARAIRSSEGGARLVHLVGDVPRESAAWQLPVIIEGAELPGGGFLMFPGRRLVALYGHPGAPALGSLGEQGMRRGLDRLEGFRSAYEADGLEMVPTFEIIATIADAAAGSDGDYSAESSVSQLREWVDFAAEREMYVVLDLQPGRADFLAQAKLYEELLLEPHVGLALDPEWRLKPDEFHLRQIGSVRAGEVNTVVDWLARLVRDNGLPQKLLLLHQFRIGMLINRENIRTPPELAVVIQMDGHGDLPTKLGTWGVITAGWEGFGWRYGWKNFFDEDRPMPTADDVLALTPTVVFVSFQ